MERSYLLFNEKVNKDKRWEQFRPLFNLIAQKMKGIYFDKVAFNCCFNDGSFNISFKLADNVILSINKRLEDINNNFVGFNLMHKKELMISDINTLDNLHNYIVTVQNSPSKWGIE